MPVPWQRVNLSLRGAKRDQTSSLNNLYRPMGKKKRAENTNAKLRRAENNKMAL